MVKLDHHIKDLLFCNHEPQNTETFIICTSRVSYVHHVYSYPCVNYFLPLNFLKGNMLYVSSNIAIFPEKNLILTFHQIYCFVKEYVQEEF